MRTCLPELGLGLEEERRETCLPELELVLAGFILTLKKDPKMVTLQKTLSGLKSPKAKEEDGLFLLIIVILPTILILLNILPS